MQSFSQFNIFLFLFSFLHLFRHGNSPQFGKLAVINLLHAFHMSLLERLINHTTLRIQVEQGTQAYSKHFSFFFQIERTKTKTKRLIKPRSNKYSYRM